MQLPRVFAKVSKSGVPVVAVWVTMIGGLPGLLLLAAVGLLLAGTTRAEVAAAFTEQHWRVALLAACGAYYVLLGATALGGAGALGIVGGVLLWAVPAAARRSHRTGYGVLLAGALPFAVITWWSVVTPLIALLAIWFGRTVIRGARGDVDAGGDQPARSHDPVPAA